MLARLFPVREHERRYVALLGGFTFFQLAATTILAAASDALFVDTLGADQLPYGLMLGQALAIVGFAGYRMMRSLLRTKLLNPVVVTVLALGLVVVYYFVTLQSRPSLYLLIGLGPLYAAILASEYGRIAASVLDVRSARRLLPLLGTIGGLGATAGAYLVGKLASVIGPPALLLISVAAMLAVIVPAAGIRESMRPRNTTASATTKEVLSNRYALALALGATVLIIISTIVRTQFAAVAAANYSGDDLTEFYGDFYYVLNLASIAVTLFVGRALVRVLGAARALLIYPITLLAASITSLFMPGLWTTAASQMVERLFRQNVHGPNSSIVGMPLPTGIRIQMAMLLTGTLRPTAVVAASTALLFTLGDFAPPQFTLEWTQLPWAVGLLTLILLGLMWFVRKRYAQELQSALQARRLHLDENVDEAQPLDSQLRLVLHGYLASDLPERTALALELLRQDLTPETIALIRRQWVLWEDGLKDRAIDLLVQDPSAETQAFLLSLEDTEPDAVIAKSIVAGATQYSAEQLWARVASHQPETRAQALAILAGRPQEADAQRARETLDGWLVDIETETPTAKNLAPIVAAAIRHWPNGDYDNRIPELIRTAPNPILDLINARPQPIYAPLCVPYLGNDSTYSAARLALQTIGEPAVPPLEAAALDRQAPSVSCEVLTSIEGHSAHLASMRLMSNSHQRIRHRATTSRLHAPFALSAAELSLVDDNLEQALSSSVRYHSYLNQDNQLNRHIAMSERNASLDEVFLNLSLANGGDLFRRAYLAQQSSDKRQRAFALELLDEVLPRQVKTRLLPVLEEQPVKVPQDMAADRHWLELQERLMAGKVQEVPLRNLVGSATFSQWRVADLEALNTQTTDNDVNLILRGGEFLELEKTLITGQSVEPQDGDHVLPLAAVYRAIRQQPRCGQLWLRQLAERVPQPVTGDVEVTRSAMVSLASRTVADDRDAADELALWQRMFFLRSCPFTQDLPPPRLRLVAEISRSLQAAAGETVVFEGRLGNHFYLVCTGRLEVSHGGQAVAELGPSDGFGALALMRGERRSLTVKAVEPCELLAISRVDFLDLIDVHPSLVRSLARTLAAQILATDQYRN